MNSYNESLEESLYSCRCLVDHFGHEDLAALVFLHGGGRLTLSTHL